MERTDRSLVAVLTRLMVVVVVGAVAMVAAPAPRVAANTLVVTNTSSDGPGSLRWAISEAFAGDTITFDSSVHGGTITLPDLNGNANVSLVIAKALSIIGPGPGLLTIHGNNDQQIFHISTNGDDRVTISGLTLTGGYSQSCGGCYVDGGAIYIQGGVVTLANLLITGNESAGDGGGLLVAARGYGDPPNTVLVNTEVTLIDSIVSNNSASNAGGISLVRGKLRIERSAIHGNEAISKPIPVSGYWGGVQIGPEGTLTMVNSTVSGNTALKGGGGISASGSSTTTIDSSTIVGNRGDVDNDGVGDGGGIRSGSIRNSIVIGNSGANGQPDDCSFGASQGHNLFGAAATCGPLAPGDLTLSELGVGVGAVLDPTLVLNAPGTTPTHALVPGSPAMGAAEGGANCPATDQRGIPRPQGGGCDIGAYEFATLHNVVLTTSGPGSASATPGGPYASGQQVTLTASWDATSAIFAGWSVDGQLVGWANPLLLPIAGQSHAVNAMFVPRKSFGDVGGSRVDHRAITELASRGTILGYGNGRYGPDDGVQRAQMAALIARATPLGPGIPKTTLIPPACIVGGTWDCEDWGNDFRDGGGLDPHLWRNVGALQHHGVAYGYDGAGCAARNVPSPCFAPNEVVTYAQTISFITRAMQAKGFWIAQPGQAIPYPAVPAAHLIDFKTFYFYTQGQIGIPMPPANWNAQATRGWFALALWAALESYYSTNRLP